MVVNIQDKAFWFVRPCCDVG